MKIQDVIPVLSYNTKIAVCTTNNMLFYGTKEDLLSETQANIYLIICDKDISDICIEQNTLRIEI